MSRLVARILLSIFMFPLAALLYTLCVVIGIDLNEWLRWYRARNVVVFLTSDVITWAGVATYWILLWRQSVPWTPQRIRRTQSAAVIAAVAATGSGFLAAVLPDVGAEFPSFVGGVIAIMLWLVATVLIWRETPGERSARVSGTSAIVCPTCGYNLTGLTGTRCPECGSQFTLNELMAAQPSQAAAEIE